ncbi:flagellar hook-length control protein FliK [Rheinheimera fenheensis]|uniref:flagellar hook-length control protein FliK n=1 Tax=Rheinheimera fenheensis TaxID=3152295 RepID=UPI00325F69F6
MTQGLQLSILMTGAETALLSEAIASEADSLSVEGGLAFGDMLGQLVSPAKNGQDSKGRQLPADISLLSAVSQAVTAATEAGASEMLVTDEESAADSELTASILAQLSFAAVSADGKTDGEKAVANSAELAARAAQRTKSGANADAATTEEATETDAVKAKPAVPELTLSNGKPEAEVLLSAAQGKSEADADTELSAAAKTKKLNTEADVKLSAQQGKLAEEKRVTQTVAPNDDMTAAVQTQQAQTDAATQAANKQMGVEQTLLSGAGQDSKAQKVTATASSKTALQAAKAVSAEQPGQGGKQGPLTANVTDQQLRTGEPSEAVLNSDNQSAKTVTLANQPAGQAADKAASSAAKSGTEDNPQSSQQRQQGSAALQEILQQQAAAGIKVVEQPSAMRSEQPFSATIAQAEQRQAGALRSAEKPAASVAEQLKQSLNLLQQDAAGQLRERVNLMVRQNIQVAEIRLDPAGLGQMQIKIDMQQDQASVQFVVQQPQAKELLEQQLPRLREMLQQQGILLSEGQVQQQSQQQRQSAQHSGQGNSNGRGHGESGDDIPATQVQVSAAVSERLVDYYA